MTERVCVSFPHLQRHITIYETLKRIGDAEQRRVDTWAIALTSPREAIFAQLPHSLEPVALSGSGRPQPGSAPPEAVTKARPFVAHSFCEIAGVQLCQLAACCSPERVQQEQCCCMHKIFRVSVICTVCVITCWR